MTLGHKTLDDLLAPISAQLGRKTVPEEITRAEIRSVPKRHGDGLSQEELVNMFDAEAVKVRVQMHRCTSWELGSTLAELISAEGPGDVVMANDPRLTTYLGTLESCDAVETLTVWDSAKPQECVDAAVKARYGIAYAQAGIAETATVVQPISADCARAITLTPLTHIAVVDADSIVSTMADVLADYEGKQMPSQICFVSGPSATADIELVRVEGVHGPMYVHYVVVE